MYVQTHYLSMFYWPSVFLSFAFMKVDILVYFIMIIVMVLLAFMVKNSLSLYSWAWHNFDSLYVTHVCFPRPRLQYFAWIYNNNFFNDNFMIFLELQLLERNFSGNDPLIAKGITRKTAVSSIYIFLAHAGL